LKIILILILNHSGNIYKNKSNISVFLDDLSVNNLNDITNLFSKYFSSIYSKINVSYNSNLISNIIGHDSWP